MDSVRNADNFNLAVKQKIIDMGHQLRTQPPLYGEGGAILNFPADHLNYGNDIVSTLLTGYNGAYDGMYSAVVSMAFRTLLHLCLTFWQECY